MKSRLVYLLLVSFLFVGSTVASETFVLSSPDIADGKILTEKQVLDGFGCSGSNISPQLNWSGEPVGTKSFALTVYDPDAPTGSGWWHWVIFNIDNNTHKLVRNAGSLKAKVAPNTSMQSRTDFGAAGFGGACPPEGDKAHRYQFTLYALDVEKLDLSADSSAAMVGFMLNKHMLASARIEAIYRR